MSEESTKFKILSLDGGGIRGYYSLIILQKIEEEFKINLCDFFDLIIGTSTGSIIAGGIACNIPTSDLIALYKNHGKNIFKKKKCGLGFFRSKYRKDQFKKVLQVRFSDVRLGEIAKPLMIVSSDLINDNVYILKSKYLSEIESYSRDKDTKLIEAILASCSAPTYFDPQQIGNGDFLCDGGLWANNPSILGLTEAMSKFNKQINDIFVMSIGTGYSETSYDTKYKKWGILTGWGRKKFINYILNLSSKTSTNISSLILKENYIRVNSNIKYPLNNVKDMVNLKSLANKCFLDNKDRIETFLNKINN